MDISEIVWFNVVPSDLNLSGCVLAKATEVPQKMIQNFKKELIHA